MKMLFKCFVANYVMILESVFCSLFFEESFKIMYKNPEILSQEVLSFD